MGLLAHHGIGREIPSSQGNMVSPIGPALRTSTAKPTVDTVMCALVLRKGNFHEETASNFLHPASALYSALAACVNTALRCLQAGPGFGTVQRRRRFAVVGENQRARTTMNGRYLVCCLDQPVTIRLPLPPARYTASTRKGGLRFLKEIGCARSRTTCKQTSTR